MQRLVSRVSVSDEPAPDDRPRSSHTSPAVNIYGPSFAQGIVYGVEYPCHLFPGPRDRQVTYRVSLPSNLQAKGTGSLLGYLSVWDELAEFGQVDEVVDPSVKQHFELPGRLP